MPEIRPFRALRYDPSRRRRPRPRRRAAVRRHRPRAACRAAGAPPGATSSAWTCRRASPATSPTTAIGGPRGRWRRGARTGRCARTRIRRSTSTSRPTACPGTDVERTQRGFFARLRLEPFGPGAGVLPHERTLTGAQGGPLQAAAGDRGQHEPGRRRCSTTRAAGRGDACGRRGRPAGRRRRRRRRRPPSPVGRAGRRARARRRRSPALARGRRGRAGHHRRRPPPLRDGAALSRRAPDDAARARRTRRSTTC